MSRGKLIVISAPSGTGKGSICNRLFGIREHIVFSISMTTREPRPGEVEGKNYYFVDKSEFEQMIENHGFLEYANVFGNYYGTPREKVTSELDKGNDVLLEIDVQGAMDVKKALPEAMLIFVFPPSMKELKNRITGRGTETKESISIRLGKALKEMEMAKHYDYLVINDDIEEAVQDVISILRAKELEILNGQIEISKYKEEDVL